MDVIIRNQIKSMTEFTFLYRGTSRATSPDEKQKVYAKWAAWFENLKQRGALVNIGHPLEKEGSVIAGTSKVISDGPFAEAKDVIGGYSIVSASSLAEATELGKGCPILEHGGSIEIRPIMLMGK
jgi:hypothetical protein